MNTDIFLNKLEEFWGDFNCYNCCAFNEGCNTNYSCTTQCLKEFIQANNLTIMTKDDIFANELLEKVTIKYVKEILLNVDWDDFNKYKRTNCNEIKCRKCKYYGEELCGHKLLIQYLREKSL